MHCSSFEPFLDAYVEGELSPARAAKLAAHLDRCTECSAILAELRVIDGLLLEPRHVELAPNFTFKVMAEARALPAPRAHRTNHLGVLGTYVVFAWVAIASFLLLGGTAARSMIALFGVWGLHFERAFERLSFITAHLFGHQAFDVTAMMGAAIALDLVGAAVVVGIYARRRNRRAFEGSPE